MSNPSTPWGEYADLDAYGQQAAPQHAFRPTTETLSAGDYDCEIIDAALDKVSGHRICRVGLRVLNAGGRVVEHTYWLNRQEGVNGFLAEMQALGFPSSGWGNVPGKVPLGQAIPDAVSKLKGIKFRATKSSRNVPAKPAFAGQPAREAATYHEWFIGGRITGQPMPNLNAAPAAVHPAPAPQQQPNGQRPATVPAYDDSQIPF